jgi:hypothetical protein
MGLYRCKSGHQDHDNTKLTTKKIVPVARENCGGKVLVDEDEVKKDKKLGKWAIISPPRAFGKSWFQQAIENNEPIGIRQLNESFDGLATEIGKIKFSTTKEDSKMEEKDSIPMMICPGAADCKTSAKCIHGKPHEKNNGCGNQCRTGNMETCIPVGSEIIRYNCGHADCVHYLDDQRVCGDLSKFNVEDCYSKKEDIKLEHHEVTAIHQLFISNEQLQMKVEAKDQEIKELSQKCEKLELENSDAHQMNEALSFECKTITERCENQRKELKRLNDERSILVAERDLYKAKCEAKCKTASLCIDGWEANLDTGSSKMKGFSCLADTRKIGVGTVKICLEDK